MPESGLQSALECVDMKRSMFAENPKMAAESLSRALDTLSDIEEAFGGKDEEALASILEALEIQRKLYQEHPARHRDCLAAVLFHASLRYANVDRRVESEASRVECEELCRVSNGTRRKVVRNLRVDMRRHLNLGRASGLELMRSLLEALEGQVDGP
jgi:hypothetical protein